MYRFHPTSSFASYPTDLGNSSLRYSARDKYLASLAEARAAKEEYLAAEAAQREEDALLHRLEELQLRKQRDAPVRIQTFPRRSHDLDRYGYKGTQLRSGFEDEEFTQFTLTRQRQQEIELELLRRRQNEEAELLTLKRKGEEQKLKELTRLRETEEARLLALRRFRTQKATENKTLKPHTRGSQQAPVNMPLDQLFSSPSRSTQHRQDLCCRSQETSDHAVSDIQTMLLNHLVGRQVQPVKEVKPDPSPEPQSTIPSSEAQALEQLFTHFIRQLHPQQSKKEESQNRATSFTETNQPSLARNSASAPRCQEPRLRIVFGPSVQSLDKEKPKSVLSSTSAVEKLPAADNPKSSSESAPQAVLPSLSLKEQLESRLNNDHSIEIRDTIQAILASLSDAPAITNSFSSIDARASSSTPAASGSKGKGKAPEPESAAESTSTSKDVVQALETIRNIEASFTVLQDEFEFPSQLEFSPSPSRSSSPVRDDSSNSESMARKLAYTARNHPVRFYEQSLTNLLAQLDVVDSHGSSDVRTSRKSVVSRVEEALEELEKRVESRWKKWSAAKETRVSREENTKDAEARKDVSALERTLEHVDTAAEIAPDAEPSAKDAADSTLSSSTYFAHSEPTQDAEIIEQPSAIPDTVPSPVVDAPVIQLDGPVPSEEYPSNSQPEIEHIAKELNQDVTLSDVETAETHSSSSRQPDIASSYPPAPTALEAPSSYSPITAASSVETLRPAQTTDTLEAEIEGEGSLDTFLLTSDPSESTFVPSRKAQDAEDVGSDWSEVEA